jgi:diguanylate cyclase (GGDEF)-like protein/PAS domain S-box-containing protein
VNRYLTDKTKQINLKMQTKIIALQEAIYNCAHFSSIATNAEGIIQTFNVGAERMLGYTAEEVINTLSLTDISDPQEIIEHEQLLSIESNTNGKPGFQALVYRAPRGIEEIQTLIYIRKDGSRLPVVVSIAALHDAEKNIIGYLIIGTENTAHEIERNRLLLSDAALKAIGEGVVITDSKGITIYANNAFSLTTGYSQKELIGNNLSLLKGRLTDSREISKIRKSINSGTSYSGEILNYKKDGSIFWHQMTITPISNKDGTSSHYIGITQDVTSRRNRDEENKKHAYHDYLTSLPNRRLLHDRLNQIIASNKRTGNNSAMIVIDFDNFKAINDNHGHATGDLFLIEASNRIMMCIRESDTVARVGGDEFVVLLKDLNAVKDIAHAEAMKIAEKIRALISIEFNFPVEKNKLSKKYNCTASLGLIIFTCPSISTYNIIKYADAAMYKSKRLGKNMIMSHQSAELDPQNRNSNFH